MKPIENIFGFDCVTCEHNRHCYGGDIGNQFKYCEKSAKKIQNSDNFEQENKKLTGVISTYEILLKANAKENKKLKDNWIKLKKYIRKTKLKEFEKSCGKRYGKTFTQAGIIVCNMILDKMQELEKGCDSNE